MKDALLLRLLMNPEHLSQLDESHLHKHDLLIFSDHEEPVWFFTFSSHISVMVLWRHLLHRRWSEEQMSVDGMMKTWSTSFQSVNKVTRHRLLDRGNGQPQGALAPPAGH